MANTNLAASFGMQGGFLYQKDVTGGKPVVAASLFSTPLRKTFTVTGSGAGVATKAYELVGQTIAAAGTYELDLGSFTDQHEDSAAWAKLKLCVIRHDSGSAASDIEMVGDGTNAQPGLRTSTLLPGDWCVPLFAPTSVGMNITGANDKILIVNNDGTNAATFSLLILGE